MLAKYGKLGEVGLYHSSLFSSVCKLFQLYEATKITSLLYKESTGDLVQGNLWETRVKQNKVYQYCILLYLRVWLS